MAKSALIESVKRLDLDATVTLLNARPSLVATRDPQGRNLLHVACCVSPAKLGVPGTAQTRFVKVLLDCGLDADIDAPIGRDACTGLFFAVARARNLPLVRLLLRRGARPELAPGGGLFAAGWWQDLAIMDSLIRAGASIDIVVGVTPFLACWCWRRFDAAKRLALRGANVNYQDQKGKTALHHGIEKQFDPPLLRWLVVHGASPDIIDRDGVSARARAARKRDKRFIAALG